MTCNVAEVGLAHSKAQVLRYYVIVLGACVLVCVCVCVNLRVYHTVSRV